MLAPWEKIEPRTTEVPRMGRLLVYALAVVVLVVVSVQLGESRGNDQRAREDRHALVACLANEAYTRALLDQCVDDYRESGRR